jgi:hypothetical protein
MNVQEHIKKMHEMFGDLPNPKHEPKRFAFYVKLYKFYTQRV